MPKGMKDTISLPPKISKCVRVRHIQFFNHSYINSNRFKHQMQNQESFGAQLAQSEEEFKRQFDPSSPSYHAGLAEVVPTGGSRVPDSMPSVYPEGYDPTKPQEVIDYGDKYREVEANRNVYQNLKKELAKLGPVVEAFLRHEDHFKTKGDPTSEQHKAVYEANIAKETTNLKAVQEGLQTFVPVLEAMDAEGKECAKELTDIIFLSGKKYETKQALTDFNFQTKKLSTRTFSIAQKCLQKLKDIKKEHASKQKAAGQTKQEEPKPEQA